MSPGNPSRAARASTTRATAPPAWAVMTAAWLIPGAGFWLNGRRGRAMLFFLSLQSAFLVGAALKGVVLWPDWNPGGEGFNIVNILAFAVQMFNGLLGLVSLLPDLAGAKLALLPYRETHATSELGSFFMLVSGGMNYFVLTGTWDSFYAPARPAAVEASVPEAAA